MAGKSDRSPSWMKVTGIGFEFAAAIAGFTLVGYWIDRSLGSFPVGLLIGIGLGLVGGGYNLIRASLAASREAEREHREERDRQSKV